MRSFLVGFSLVCLGAVAVAQEQPFAGQTITVLLEGHPSSDAVQRMIPAFTEATGINVNAEIVPYNDLTARALLEFSTQSGRYDIVMDDWVHGVGYASAGYLSPVDGLAEQLPTYYNAADFVPKYLTTLRYENQQFGVPVYGESTFLMYRKDLFDDLGIEVPATFEELEAAAKTVYESTGGDVAGITLRGEQGIQNVYVWAAFLWGFGGQWLEGDASAVGSAEAVEALDFYARLLREYGPTGVANFGWQENRLLFQQGGAAMTIDATVNGAFNEDPDESSVVGRIGYAPVPMSATDPRGGSSSLAVHGFYLAADSDSPEAAWLFMTWATNAAQQTQSLTTDPHSGMTSMTAMESDAFLERYGSFKEAMLQAIDRGNPQYLPNIPQANEIINNTGVAISQVLAGSLDAQTALSTANDENNSALGQ